MSKFQPKTIGKPVELPQEQVDRLSLLNELVADRQEEADKLRYELVATQAQISSLKRQWEQSQRHDQEQFAAWMQEQKDDLAQQQNALSTAYRQAQESLQRQQGFEESSRLKLIDLNTKGEEFRQLAQDRIDISRLRAQAEVKMREAQTLFGQAQHTQNQANAVMTDAKTIREDCEARNQQMQQAWSKIQEKEEDLRLRGRDVEMREQELKLQEALRQAVQAEQTEVALS